MSKKELISFTKKSLIRLLSIGKETNNYNFLLSVKSGGCGGFEYLINNVKEEAISDLDHKIEVNQKDLNIYLCNHSSLFLIGTEIDWKSNIMEKKFIFNNPNSGSTCGCGVSFTPKF